MSSKGKQIASKGKRKCDNEEDKSGNRKKRKNPGVLQFFEDAAEVDDYEASDDSDFDNDFMEEGFNAEPKVNNEPGKSFILPVFPKEEDLDEEFDKMMEERYKAGSAFVTYAEDDFEAKRSIERNYLMPSAKDPTVWKVKCMVGRERHSAFCLMQKFVDLQSLGTKLKIISAFAVEHVKGFIFIEADKQCDINEACKGICSIYSSRVAPVPKNEVSHLLSVRNKYNGVSEGMWTRVKNGTYKGDLAQVVAVNEARKKATIKLIPRIDLRSMAQKIGDGITAKKNAAPAPKLISSSELEEFRPLIQYRRDRDTGKVFEVLDNLMLKDGYLYKKVSIDSLSCSGVMPLEEELLKFKPSEINESGDMGWLSQLYGEQKKKLTIKTDKGCAKGEGSSSSTMVNGFELFDLVCFGRKDFGLIIGMEKDDHYKILKNGPEGSVVVILEQHELKNGCIDKKFTALDQRMKTISINDTVKVLEGPSKDRQGIVRHVYRGTVFLYDENETENSGYFCCKSQMCEKIKIFVDASNEKGGTADSGFEDFMSSPKSPLSPKKPWQARENNSDFNRGDKDGMFSIGQALRIRIGPLKGYLCRVLAVRHSDVTVKLDSQQKVLTVKCEHLSEVRGKSSSMYTSEDPGSGSLKPFDLLGTDGSSRDWMDGAGAGTSAEGDGWNAGGLSAGRSSWPSFSTSGNSLQPESNPANLFGSVDNDQKKDVEDTAWESKVTPNQNSSWGTSSADKKAVDNSDWGKSEDGWNKAAAKTGSGSSASDSWGKAIASSGGQAGSSKDAGDGWGQPKLKVGIPADSSNDAAASWEKNNNVNDNQESWKKSEHRDKGKNVSGNSSGNWGDVTSGKDQLDSWGKGKDVVSAGGSTWGKAVESEHKGTGRGIQEDSWGKAAEKWSSKDGSSGSKADLNNSMPAAEKPTGGWGNAGGSWSQPKATDETDSWKKPKDAAGNGGSWNKQDGGSSWGKQDGESSWGKQDGGSSWSKEDGGRSSYGGCGSGGRGGRGGGRGGRDQYGRGRSFDQGPSSGWSKGGQENNWTSVGLSSGNASGLNNDQTGGWGNKVFDGGREDGWKKPNASAGDNGSSWNKGWGADKEVGESGDKWNSVKPSGGNNGSTADGEAGGTGDQGGWNNRKAPGNNSWDTPKAPQEKSSGWSQKSAEIEKVDDHKNQGGGWNSRKIDGGSASRWGQTAGWKGVANDAGGNQDSNWGKKSNWNSGSSDAGENKDSDWGKKSSWNSGSADANQDSGWGKKSDWNCGNAFGGNQSLGGTSEDQTENVRSFGGRDGSDRGGFRGRGGSDRGGIGGRGRSDRGGYGGRGRSDRGGFGGRGGSDRGGFGGRGRGRRDWNNSNDSGEDKPFDWNKGGNDNGEGWKSNDGPASWNQGGGDQGQWKGWNSGSDVTSNQAGGWNSKGSGWSQTAEAKDAGGSNDLAGGGYGGRGRSDRGGFRGRGGSDRGGFGGRGRGRRDWNNSNDSGEDKAFDWKKGANNNGEGWKSNDGAVSWNQGGVDQGQWKGWNSRSDATSNQAGGWNSKGSGWNQTAEAKDAGGSNDLAGGWNKGTGSTNETGGSQGNNWKSSDVSGGGQPSSWNQSAATTKEIKGTNDQGGGWNKASGGGAQAGGWDNKGSGWSRGTGSENEGATGDQAKALNQSNAVDRGQSSGWNQSKDTKEGTNGGGEPTNSWGKAAVGASSWGKGSGGNGQGGW